MKYFIFFMLIAVCIGFELLQMESHFKWLLIWPIINMVLMSAAYAWNAPGLVLGKKRTGKINPGLLVINFPWLLLTWLTWIILAYISRELPYNQIGDSNLYLGRYPAFTDRSLFSVIIDLTCEFPAIKSEGCSYYCVPNLDGVVLRNPDLKVDFNTSEAILIHCAQGHGRSATFASHLYFALHGSVDVRDVLYLIQKSRPGAKPSKAQMGQIYS